MKKLYAIQTGGHDCTKLPVKPEPKPAADVSSEIAESALIGKNAGTVKQAAWSRLLLNRRVAGVIFSFLESIWLNVLKITAGKGPLLEIIPEQCKGSRSRRKLDNILAGLLKIGKIEIKNFARKNFYLI